MTRLGTRPDSPNIAARLGEVARQHPTAPAVFLPASGDGAADVAPVALSYRDLDEISDELALGFRAIGIAAGTRAVMMVPPGPDLFALVFAIFKAGIVPVLIDPGIGLRNLKQCCREAAPEVFIGIPKAILAGRVLGWGRETVRRRIVVAPRRGFAFLGAINVDAVRQRGRAVREGARAGRAIAEVVPSDEPAAILFTSGSTGPPKGAIYTQGILNAQVERIREMFAIEPGEVDLCTFPLFALFAPALGMSAIVPDMDPTRPARANPARIVAAIEAFGATNLFGSPALLRQLTREGETPSEPPSRSGSHGGSPFREEAGVVASPGGRGSVRAGWGLGSPGGSPSRVGARTSPLTRLPGLKRVVSAGAPVSARIIERMAARLEPPAQVHTVYGATEALPVASIGSDEILGETRHATDRGLGVCVGRPLPGIEVRIVRISDDPIPDWSDDLLLPDGTVGEIAVSGPVVSPAYFNRPEATRLAKIVDPARSVLYHRMGDLGYLDDRGRIWFCGRKSHRVVLADETLFTIPCEAIFNTHPDVFRSALVGVRRGGETRPLICIEPARRLSRAERERVRRDLLERGAGFPHTRRIREILFHPAFPVDIRHNSKIFREQLAVWAGRRLP